MKIIELYLECHTGENDPRLEELGIEQPDSVEYRKSGLAVDHIKFFYPNSEGGTYVNMGSSEVAVKETYEEVKIKCQDH
jgi:hypothetical protein